MRETHSVQIARAPAEVFAFADDPDEAPRWAEGLVRFEVTDAKPGRVGTRYTMVVKEGGRENAYDGETLAWEAGRLKREVVRRGGMEMFMELRVEPADGGALVTQDVEVPVKGLWKLMSPLMRLMVRRSQRRQLAKLKELLEAGA